MWILAGIVLLALAVFLFIERPRLDPCAPEPRVPNDLNLTELAEWLNQQEQAAGNVIPGAEATITWATPESPEKTPLCFMYIHGFSATRQETAPLTERIATHFGGNTLYVRIAGHGTGPEGMLTEAEAWLQSMVDAWRIATQLGDQVVLVGTSTGAPLSIWLACQPDVGARIYAMLFMSPNFRVRNRFGFLLTWPLARHWIQWIAGKTHQWEPINEEHGRYWSNRYATRAIIEMQKMVDWANRQDLGKISIPLAVMYMKNDPVVDADSAIKAFHQWGAERKRLIPVAIDGDKAEHVFVGRITAPHRIDWCVDQFIAFLDDIGD
ncbi:MAG: alpha/beta fold hydrolase [Pseudomonadales bacterium]